MQLGLCWMNGNGVVEDGEKAAGLFREAAECGNIDGKLQLGACFRKAHVVEKTDEVVRVFREAIEAGNLDARSELGAGFID